MYTEVSITCFFFFQAEDGIRDHCVTGVQTCALPILTGQAHWELLIRARAVEDQAFVVAAGQIGAHPPDKESFGGSTIVDPWGEVLALAPAMESVGPRRIDHSAPRLPQECFVAADLDLARQEEVREKLPSLANRMPDAYRWPERVGV